MKNKINLYNQYGELVEAQAPIIVSASRSTDIPAFYSDWLIDRLKKGYVIWKNPFNGVPLYVGFQKTRLIVFWSKNPKPIFKHIDFLEERGLNFYFQYTLNDYDHELLEPNVPNVGARIDSFRKLSERLGPDRVIWRFDPLILTDKIDVEALLRKVERIGGELKGFTRKLVFSFADINSYKKVQGNLVKNGINYREFDRTSMLEFAAGLHQVNQSLGLEIGTCAESIPLESYGIQHNKCIDDDLIIRLFKHDRELMDFMGVKIIPQGLFEPEQIIKPTNKDKGQRALCGCIVSKDIGQYNTCPHYCEYCYANASRKIVEFNYLKHKQNPLSETITGE